MAVDAEQVRRAVLEALPHLRRFALSLTGDPASADDLVQATVLKVLERPGRYRKQRGKPFRSWLFRLCRNVWIDEWRRERARGGGRMTTLDALGDPPIDGAGAMDARLDWRDTMAVFTRLPEAQREVLQLVAVEGMSYREAAEILAVPVGTVMSRLARARSRLVGELRARDADPVAGEAE